MNNIVDLIRENLFEIIPELEGQDISNDAIFPEIGANSVDRGELITLTLGKLELGISRIELVKAKTINELASLLSQKINGT